MIRHHPQWKWIPDAPIGRAQGVQIVFAYPTLRHDNIRNVPEYGGGPLYDIGCYAIMAGILIFGGGPDSITVEMAMDDAHGVKILPPACLCGRATDISVFPFPARLP